jgi:hypothetical protein
MANTRELSINAVTQNKPKVLRGLSQKGTVEGTGAEISPVMGNNTTGGKREPNPSLANRTEHGKPIVLP